jgi:hypothetical protein
MMKTLPLWIALSACATDAPVVATSNMSKLERCSTGESKTGSNIPKREVCDEVTAEEREAARRQTEALRKEQTRRAGPIVKP